MIEDRQNGAGHQTGPARALGGRRQKNHRVRAVAAIIMEIMLDDPDVSEAEIIGLFREGERLSKILGPGFLFRLDVGKELYPELHFVLRRPQVQAVHLAALDPSFRRGDG